MTHIKIPLTINVDLWIAEKELSDYLTENVEDHHLLNELKIALYREDFKTIFKHQNIKNFIRKHPSKLKDSLNLDDLDIKVQD